MNQALVDAFTGDVFKHLLKMKGFELNASQQWPSDPQSLMSSSKTLTPSEKKELDFWNAVKDK
eukprot:5742838-Pyramimonas_sp.AAC.1